MMKAIDKGDMAPDFDLPTDGGSHYNLSASREHPVIVRVNGNASSPRRKRVNTTWR